MGAKKYSPEDLDYLILASEYVTNEDAYENFEEFFLRKARGKVKQKLKKVADKVKAGVKKAASALGEVGAWALLMPFQVAIIAALKAKKLKVPKSTKDRAELFYKTFINKNYDENLEHAIGSAVTVGTIVNAIINYIKQAKKNREEGKQLSPADQALISAAEVSASQLTTAAEIDIQNQEGRANKAYRNESSEPDDGDNSKMLMIGIFLLILLFAFKGK
jgi:hypothetical protein